MSSVDLVIDPRRRPLGGMDVGRVLPVRQRRHVGPFVFLDHMGPVEFPAGAGTDIGPHPHIGLATVTYLLEGHLLHRDSLGTVQEIAPFDVNWMSAGRGIVHSERSTVEARQHPHRVHGLQFWVALPRTHEDGEPSFQHAAAAQLPEATDRGEGARLRVVVGEAFGLRSPVIGASPLQLVDLRLDAGARLPLEPVPEQALYLLEGRVSVDGEPHDAGRMLVLAPAAAPLLEALTPARLVLIGGAPLEGPRHIWWNFVHSSEDRIEQAKADWQADRFPAIPGEHGRIPLPFGGAG